MKLCVAFSLLTSTAAFVVPQKGAFVNKATQLAIGRDSNVDLGGNTWSPDEGKMKATDVGDYFPDDYEAGVDYTEGMMGSQAGGNRRDGPELPGMENLGADAIMMGGIETASDIPAGMEFIPSSVPDGNISFQVAASGSGSSELLVIKPMCMTFEDYYAAFTADSNPSLSVSPATGRMDRRGGEVTELYIKCDPRGQSGMLKGTLVVNLPEDNSKLTYIVEVNSF